MNENQNSNVKENKGIKEEKDQATNQPSSGSSGQAASSSSGTGTTVSSADTVPTQEPSSLIEDCVEDTTAWGVLYPIDRCFYPLDLREDVYTFGRGHDCTYSFDVPSIKHTQHFKSYSKIHFTIKRSKTSSAGVYSVLLIDSSMNGVFVNGEKVPTKGSRMLKDKDEIAISTDKNKILFFVDKTQEDDPHLPQQFKDKYIMHKIIGNGAFGEVREAWSKLLIERYAVKIINKQKTIFNSKDPDKVNEDIMKEAKLMLSLHHPCVIRVQDVIDSPKSLYIVLELACGGELFTRILKKGLITEPISKLIFYQMASAVAYLHDNSVTHRDLKPENILMMSDEPECLIKITDFGVSRLVGETSFMQTQAGTPSYLAPELLKTFRSPTHQGYTKQVDSWSMGVVLYVCLVGFPPFARDRKDADDQDLVHQILDCNYNFNHPRWLNVSENGKDMVSQLLKLDAKERLTPKQALEHDWMKDDVMKSKAHALMSQSVVSTPSHNYSLINKIEQGDRESSAPIDWVVQNSEISNASTKSVTVTQEKRAEKRPPPSDTSSEGDNSNGSSSSLHLKEKHFAGATSAEPDVPKLQEPHFDKK